MAVLANFILNKNIQATQQNLGLRPAMTAPRSTAMTPPRPKPSTKPMQKLLTKPLPKPLMEPVSQEDEPEIKHKSPRPTPFKRTPFDQ